MIDTRKFVHVDEAARRHGVGKTKFYELIRDGVLPAYKLGRRTLISIEDLDACFERILTPIRSEGADKSRSV